jgi:carbamate kinase
MQPTMLIAVGGNALIKANEPPTVAAQRTHVLDTCRAIAEVIADGWRVVITHGNGPQVGAALLRSERAAAEAYPLPLDVCVASTQGEIGFLLQRALEEALEAKGIHRPVATVLAEVIVDPRDPRRARPTKLIGPFYTLAETAARRELGWTMVEEPPYGFRRVVASPEPREIVQESVIRTLVAAGVVVITLGGGGIPVVREADRVAGIEAVVDKDLASALLATRLHIDRFVLLTDVDRVYLEFGTPSARGLDDVSSDELRRHAADGQFPEGSMGPKVEAAVRFVDAGGREAIVTSYDRLAPALRGHAGTHVFAAVFARASEPDARAARETDRALNVG